MQLTGCFVLGQSVWADDVLLVDGQMSSRCGVAGPSFCRLPFALLLGLEVAYSLPTQMEMGNVIHSTNP